MCPDISKAHGHPFLLVVYTAISQKLNICPCPVRYILPYIPATGYCQTPNTALLGHLVSCNMAFMFL